MHADCDSFTVDDGFSSEAPGCFQTATEFSREVQGQLSLTEDQPLFMELCAGSAALSSVVKARGFDVLPIDHESNRHKTKCKVLQMDLSQQHAIDTLCILQCIIRSSQSTSVCRVGLVQRQEVYQ